MRALPAPRGHRSNIDVRSWHKADQIHHRYDVRYRPKADVGYLVASHHIVGTGTARMTIGIQMNHWHPLGIRHVGREGQRDLALVGQLSSALVFGDHEEAETTKENPSLRPHRR